MLGGAGAWVREENTKRLRTRKFISSGRRRGTAWISGRPNDHCPKAYGSEHLLSLVAFSLWGRERVQRTTLDKNQEKKVKASGRGMKGW